MKFRVERDVLADAVAWAARSLPARPPVPVLAGLLIEAGGRRPRRCRASTTRRPAGSTVDADVDEPGRVLVSGRLLADISRAPARPAGRRSTTDGTKVALTCGSAAFTLLTLPVEDYPTLPDDAGADRHRRPAPPFAAAVAQVAVAAGRDDTLPVLTGVRIEIDGDTHDPRRHRPLPARRARARLDPRGVRASRRSRWSRPARSPTPRSRSRGCDVVSRSRCPLGGAGEG